MGGGVWVGGARNFGDGTVVEIGVWEGLMRTVTYEWGLRAVIYVLCIYDVI